MMLLQNIYTKNSLNPESILVRDGWIKEVADARDVPANNLEGNSVYFENAIAFPGLINSHDHLDFDLFPPMGNKKYSNYVEWGNDIHRHNKKEIDAVLQVPPALRIQWGIYKNLLNGITTVVNHGAHLKVDSDIVTVFQDCYSLHSVQLEKNWKLKLNIPRYKDLPIVMHTGEGTDSLAGEEIDQLIQWNLRKRKLIAVHGVAMGEAQAKYFAGLVWCPATNIFLLHKTAPVNLLKQQTSIVFGTDSTLTSSWSIWDQLRLAQNLGLLTDDELYNTLTVEPAKLWQLQQQGSLKQNAIASIVIARKKKKDFLASFFSLAPEDLLLVMQKGEIRLFDKSLLEQLRKTDVIPELFTKIKINNDHKYVYGDLQELIFHIRKYYADVHFPVSLV